MLAYCGNNPVNRIDCSGADSLQFNEEVEATKDEEERVQGTIATGGESNQSGDNNSNSLGSTIIYRYGYESEGESKLVPTKADVESETPTGLSFSTKPKPGAAMVTIEEIESTGVLTATQDGRFHVSVYPIGGSIADWHAAGVNSIWTQALVRIVRIS